MKFKFAFVATIAAIAAFSFTGCSNSPKPVTGLPEATNPPQEFCFFDNTPNSDVEYTVARKVKILKGTYGSLNQVLPKVEPFVKGTNANAIMNFKLAQRFSIWPWRFVSPVATGKAILITDSKGMSCEEMGGHLEEYYANR